MSDAPDEQHTRPAGTSDAAVAAAGKVTEALETLERARGHLHDFHQLVGSTDLALDEALELLGEAGRDDVAERLQERLVGRNVLAGRWTFQVLEEFDDGCWSVFREEERHVRDELVGGRRHVFESEMKEARRTRGNPAHMARPDGPTPAGTPAAHGG